MSRTVRTHLLALVVILAFAALASVLMPDVAHAATGPTLTERVHVAVTVGKGTDVTSEQADAILEAGYLACEGIAADVPMVDLTASVSAGYGFTDEEARRLVTVAGLVLCDPAV